MQFTNSSGNVGLIWSTARNYRYSEGSHHVPERKIRKGPDRNEQKNKQPQSGEAPYKGGKRKALTEFWEDAPILLDLSRIIRPKRCSNKVTNSKTGRASKGHSITSTKTKRSLNWSRDSVRGVKREKKQKNKRTTSNSLKSKFIWVRFTWEQVFEPKSRKRQAFRIFPFK